MANLMQLINKSNTIEEKAKAVASEIVSEFKHGKIKTQNELTYKTFNALTEFYDSIGKPTMKVREAKGAPSSMDYNKTMKEVVNDLGIIVAETQNLTEVLGSAYSQIETDRQSLENRIKFVENGVKEIRFKVDNSMFNNIFMDSFANMEKVEAGFCTLPAASINTEFGYLSLGLTEDESLNEAATIEILDDSNGFPGNTHQVSIVGNKPKYAGESGINMNLADCLDKNSDTWFEYELYKISEDVMIGTLNLGFQYEEGMRWVTEDNRLKLNLRMTFDRAEVVNTFAITPFIAPDKDAAPAILSSVVVSDGKGRIRELVNGLDVFDMEKIYTFPKQRCKVVQITIEQDLPYETSIGHTYFKELGSRNLDIFKVSEVKYNKRVNGPSPQVSNLNIIYDDSADRYIQPKSRVGGTIEDGHSVKQELFELPETESDIKAYVEVLPAKRFHIGVRDVDISSKAYIDESEYVSVPYETTRPMNSLTLEVTEDVPQVFQEYLDLDGEYVDWIKYYFSIDDGSTWYPIVPDNITKREGYHKYLINAKIPAELRVSDIGYIETPIDNYSVRLKIEIRRPIDIPDAEFYSPIVSDYKLQIN